MKSLRLKFVVVIEVSLKVNSLKMCASHSLAEFFFPTSLGACSQANDQPGLRTREHPVFPGKEVIPEMIVVTRRHLGPVSRRSQ